jgi:hypothetical protein
MPKTVSISARLLAQALNAPYYLFSDLLFVSGRLDEDGIVMVDDPRSPVLAGICLRGDALKIDRAQIPEALEPATPDCRAPV